VAPQLSKYTECFSERDFKKDEALMMDGLELKELRAQVYRIVDRLRTMLNESRIALPPSVELEISHHYGIERFDECGAILLKIINRAYSKMLVVMFPGQSYPRHHHIQKDESYQILHGDLEVDVDGKKHSLKVGDVLSIDRGSPHSFRTKCGVIIEEIATTYIRGDSIYEDDAINQNPNRKIELTVWPQWLER
jgi:N-acetylneuraminate synthase